MLNGIYRVIHYHIVYNSKKKKKKIVSTDKGPEE